MRNVVQSSHVDTLRRLVIIDISGKVGKLGRQDKIALAGWASIQGSWEPGLNAGDFEVTPSLRSFPVLRDCQHGRFCQRFDQGGSADLGYPSVGRRIEVAKHSGPAIVLERECVHQKLSSLRERPRVFARSASRPSSGALTPDNSRVFVYPDHDFGASHARPCRSS